MTQKELIQMIDASHQFELTPELMSAVRKRAHRERSEITRFAMRQLRSRISAAAKIRRKLHTNVKDGSPT